MHWVLPERHFIKKSRNMVYKKYYFNIIFRVILILINCILFSIAIIRTDYLYSIIFLTFLLVLQSILLVRYLNISNVFLERFLNYAKEKNTSIEFSNSLENTPFEDLSGYFNELNSVIKNANLERENQYLFLKYIFNHVSVGLIAFDQSKKVKLINSAAQELLLVKNLSSIELLDKVNPFLAKNMLELKPQEQRIISINIENKNMKLAVKSAKFVLLHDEVNLISLQDIKNELDYNEVESWQKLNRVLTHEIMNSVSPIIGLTDNISRLLTNGNELKPIGELNEDVLGQASQSVEIIKERSKGLDDFVKKFRSITTNVKPNFKEVKVFELFEDLALLMHETLKRNKIELDFKVQEEGLIIYLDKKLIEQILINLIKNSIEALEESTGKNILLEAKELNGKKLISVTDSGKGIIPENLNLIFTPFYTTKEEGSGIGLSLSRNIMKVHGGTIDVISKPNIETTFTLTF